MELLPGNLKELVCMTFLDEPLSCDNAGPGETSLLVGVDLTVWITAGVESFSNSVSRGSEISCTEHLRRSFLHLWLILLFHKLRSVKKNVENYFDF